jgi:hypothetical protein
VLTFPYSAALVDELKAGIPYRYRTYDPTGKEWTVQAEFADFATALLLEHFPDADIPAHARWRQTRPERRGAGADHFRVLHLRETAPVELIEASYRVLARLHHPDRGGTTEAMQQINGAYAALRERVSA